MSTKHIDIPKTKTNFLGVVTMPTEYKRIPFKDSQEEKKVFLLKRALTNATSKRVK